ncbi:hypothetical protein B0H17DRAFT_1084787 [Mycena rosella]|uniref:DUF6534 domain-containing protein n=1 Tax=Mycena rosella TaxID=1033263 RepID=A0AAD7GA68_MYCRO|nr:hypothetical protein B0H17DRAFT_1084787 [Mycena rosella]
MQLNTYYQNFAKDRLSLRTLVYTVFLMDLVQTVLLTQHGWWYIITTWGDASMYTQVVWSAPVIPIMSALVSAVVQIFYAWRIWTLTTSLFMHGVAIVIVLVAIMQSTIATVAGSIVSRNPQMTVLLGLSPEFSTWLVGSLVDDIIITICMTYIVRALSPITIVSNVYVVKTVNSSQKPDQLGCIRDYANQAHHSGIQSGAATVVIAAIDLALFIQLPETNYFYVPSYILGKIYTNSFMLNLNLRRPNSGPYVDAVSNDSSTLPMNSLRSDGIRVERNTHRDVDGGDIKWVPTDPAANGMQRRVDHVDILKIHGVSD